MSASHIARYVIALVAVALLAGCSQKPMTNDAIIAETKKCNDAGMDAMPLTSLWAMGVTLAIQCRQRAAR